MQVWYFRRKNVLSIRTLTIFSSFFFLSNLSRIFIHYPARLRCVKIWNTKRGDRAIESERYEEQLVQPTSESQSIFVIVKPDIPWRTIRQRIDCILPASWSICKFISISRNGEHKTVECRFAVTVLIIVARKFQCFSKELLEIFRNRSFHRVNLWNS